jgi:hypothetical protein
MSSPIAPAAGAGGHTPRHGLQRGIRRPPFSRDGCGSISSAGHDVFGTIKLSDERDFILGLSRGMCGLPDTGPWKLKLECLVERDADSKRSLRKTRRAAYIAPPN